MNVITTLNFKAGDIVESIYDIPSISAISKKKIVINIKQGNVEIFSPHGIGEFYFVPQWTLRKI
jgi:hypothetical protein